MATPIQWWHRDDERPERLYCDLCPRACYLREGQRGFCFVRQNVGGQMQLTTYGHSTGFCVDPIEKKPLFHFLPGSSVLSFGTAGCNLGCKFCQNWAISKARHTDALTQHAPPVAIAETALRHGCDSVAFTYNDPVIWAEYAIDTALACQARGLRTVAVTAGYIQPEARPAFFGVMDAANIDLKAFSEHFYQKLAFAHLQPVLDTLDWLHREGRTWFELTTLLIPDENDSPDEVARLCDWVAEHLGPEVPLHFTAFHPAYKLLDHRPTPTATLERAREQALAAGLRYVYVGNVHDPHGESTFCPKCGALAVGRDRYVLTDYALREGRCGTCNLLLPGVFGKRAGTWGRRRLPVLVKVADDLPENLSGI